MKEVKRDSERGRKGDYLRKRDRERKTKTKIERETKMFSRVLNTKKEWLIFPPLSVTISSYLGHRLLLAA